MGCGWKWADDSHFIIDSYIEVPWTWQEYDAITDEMFAAIRAKDHPCATVVDVKHLGNFPRGNIMGSLGRMEKMMPPNVFASALVGAPYAVTVFLDILFRIRPRARRIALFTHTIEEAHDKIKDIYQQKFVLSD